MDFKMFEKFAQEFYSDAISRCEEIPQLVQEIINLKKDEAAVLSALGASAHEARTIEIIGLIKKADDALTDRIIDLIESINDCRKTHAELRATIEASRADLISYLEKIAEIQPIDAEKKNLTAQTLIYIRLNIPIRAFTLGAVLIQLYSLIGAYRELYLVFLNRQRGLDRVKDVAKHLAKAASEDVVHHFVPFLATAQALWANIVIKELDREIQSMSRSMNEFERIFLLERILKGLVTFAESTDQLVKRSCQDIVEDKRNFLALLTGPAK